MRTPSYMKTVISLPTHPYILLQSQLSMCCSRPKSFTTGYWKDHHLCAASDPRAQQLQQHDFSLFLPSCLGAVM